MAARAICLAAGGTGGHLFPAEALSAELTARGHAVELITDTRAARYAGAFPARAVHALAAGTPTGGSAFAKGQAMLRLGLGLGQAIALLARRRPLCLIGFGGYPTVPPVVAASLLRVPTILHEQNAVMGRANRFLAGRVDQIASGFPELKAPRPVTHTGNPVRPAVLAAAGTPYPLFDGGLRLLVTGGSQGARVMADVVPRAVERLSPDHRARLRLAQQARGEDEARVRGAYAAMGFAAEVAPFFPDLPARIAASHLVIGRSGASTVSELAVIGRPAILVPYPHALDQDQAANAAVLAEVGAAEVIAEAAFTPDHLAGLLRQALDDPQGLTHKAQAAKSVGLPDAAKRLADLVERMLAR